MLMGSSLVLSTFLCLLVGQVEIHLPPMLVCDTVEHAVSQSCILDSSRCVTRPSYTMLRGSIRVPWSVGVNRYGNHICGQSTL
jgi:hypothetical protein